MVKRITILSKKPWKQFMDKAKREEQEVKESNPEAKFTRKQTKNTAYVMAIEDLEEPYNTLLALVRNFPEVGQINSQFYEFLPSRENPKFAWYKTDVALASDPNVDTMKAKDKAEKDFEKQFNLLQRKLKKLKWDVTIE